MEDQKTTHRKVLITSSLVILLIDINILLALAFFVPFSIRNCEKAFSILAMETPAVFEFLFSIYSIDYTLFFVVVVIILLVKEILIRNKKATLIINIIAGAGAFIIAVAAMVTTSFGTGLVYKAFRPAQDARTGEPVVIADVEELGNTLVTVHLECSIPEGTNVIWCATFQVAWNELCDLIGGPIQLEPKQQIADVLNSKQITSDVLDPSSFVAIAGLGPETIERIEKELWPWFYRGIRSQLRPSAIAEDAWLAYAYLFQHLPFKYAFTRMMSPFKFSEQSVASFGINQYLPDSQKNEVRMARQVLVYDHRNDNDFIVELIPENQEHRIILACIPPENSLNELIKKVYTRISGNKPKRIAKSATLEIPIIDFEVVKHYSQLASSQILSSNPEINGTTIAQAMHSVRFKLDEKGAALKSEARMAASVSQDIIFDKPFLVLLMKRKAKLPYFALWLANAELLTPYQSAAVRFDGLYRSLTYSDFYHYIRFYKDGTVIAINSGKQAKQIAIELNKDRRDIKKNSYYAPGTRIRFSFGRKRLSASYEEYIGRIEGDIIDMRIRSIPKKLGVHSESREYKFIPVNFSQ